MSRWRESRWISVVSNRDGQAQLVAAAVIGSTVLAGALYSLDWVTKNKVHRYHASRRVEMRAALDLAIKHAARLYVAEAGCDPASLNDKLNFMQRDGRIVPTGTAGFPGQRQMDIAINGNGYSVAFGLPIRQAWTGAQPDPTIAPAPATGNLAMNRGVSQDATISVWTTYNSGARAAVGRGFNHERMIQSAVLINICSYRCATANATDCPAAADPSIAYHRITPATFPAAGIAPNVATWNRRCYDPAGTANRFLGDLNSSPAAPGPDGLVDLVDLTLLRNYVRSGETAGARLLATQAPTFVSAPGSGLPCADLNGDSQVNELDLHILEKVLRGYLFWLPTHTLPPPP